MGRIPNRELQDQSSSVCSTKKHKLCKRFAKTGNCWKGHKCRYIHAEPLIARRDCIVFLGGLPAKCPRATLMKALKAKKIGVLNYPVVIDRFTPRVVLSSAKTAKALIEKGTLALHLDGEEHVVDVR